MPEIHPIQPSQTAEARRVIYTVAHDLFHDGKTLEESIAYYETHWPLSDIAAFQSSYRENGGDLLVMTDCVGGSPGANYGSPGANRIIGTGALKRLEDTVGEIKRVWLLPEYHGQGLGYQMMLRLLALAREKGYQKVRLETSPQYQPRAFAFYQRIGFHVIPRYGDDEDDVGMELVLE